jgi:hypothetical protein
MKNMEDKFSEISTKYEDARILFEAQKVAVWLAEASCDASRDLQTFDA